MGDAQEVRNVVVGEANVLPEVHRDSIEEINKLWHKHGKQIQQRLEEFRLLPEHEWFYELCFCILTPQSKALHAELVVNELKTRDFLVIGGNPTEALRQKNSYIRFHNVKSARLIRLRENWPSVSALLLHARQNNLNAMVLREQLCNEVQGIGMKEASHFLRNIGYQGLAIVDRHIVRSLFEWNLLNKIPGHISKTTYVKIEQVVHKLAHMSGRTVDELDLIMWMRHTGFILK